MTKELGGTVTNGQACFGFLTRKLVRQFHMHVLAKNIQVEKSNLNVQKFGP